MKLKNIYSFVISLLGIFNQHGENIAKNKKNRSINFTFRVRYYWILLIIPLLFLLSCHKASDTENAGQNSHIPEPGSSRASLHLNVGFVGCGMEKFGAPLRISDGQLIYQGKNSSSGRPIFLAGYGSYELASDPNIVADIDDRYSAETNVFGYLLSSDPEQPKNHLNFFRLWLPGLSKGSVEWGAEALAEREELPFHLIQEGLWDVSKFDTETEGTHGNNSSNKYFSRLGRILSDAQDDDVILQLTIFDYTMMKWLDVYDPVNQTVRSFRYWKHNPWNPLNNINGLETELPTEYPPFPDFYETVDENGNSSTKPQLKQLQYDYVKTFVKQTAAYPNIFYEIMNQADGANGALLAAWHLQVSKWIKEIAPEKLISISSFPLIKYLRYCYVNNSDDPIYLELMRNIDIICYHYSDESWAKDHFNCSEDIEATIVAHKYYFGNKIAIIDTDGAGAIWAPCRENNDNIELWAANSFANGGGFNHKDYIYMDKDSSAAECLSDAATGCGFNFDCTQCGIDSVDRDAIGRIYSAYQEHSPSARQYMDIEFKNIFLENNKLIIKVKNTGTKTIPAGWALWDNCKQQFLSYQVLHELLPDESVVFTLDIPQAGKYSLRAMLSVEAKKIFFGKSLSFELTYQN